MNGIEPNSVSDAPLSEMLRALMEVAVARDAAERPFAELLVLQIVRGWGAEAAGVWRIRADDGSLDIQRCGQAGSPTSRLFDAHYDEIRNDLLQRCLATALPAVQRGTWMDAEPLLSMPFARQGEQYVLLAHLPATLGVQRQLTLLHGAQLARQLIQSLVEPAVAPTGDSALPLTALMRFHESLDWNTTSYTVVHEARELLQCDRVTLLVRQGSAYRVVTASGQVELDRRANQVRRLEQLVAAAMAWAEPLRYPAAAPLPPEIDRPLQNYLDDAPTRWLEIYPLCDAADRETGQRSETPANRAVWAALLVEDFRSASPRIASERLPMVAEVASRALGHAQEHRQIFLRPLWRALGRLTHSQNQFSTKLLVAAVVVLLLSVLAMRPAALQISAHGTMEPAHQRHVFATVGGVTEQIAVRHGEQVKEGDILLQLRNAELSAQISDLSGQAGVIAQQLASIRSIRLTSSDGGAAEELHRLAGEEQRLERQRQSLEKQLSILHAQESELTVRSPIDGVVVTWDVEQLLAGRPVERGQRLLTLANVAGEWELKLWVPDRHAGTVRAAQQQEMDAQQGGIPVEFVLGTRPRERHSALVTMVGDAVQPSARHGTELPLRAAVSSFSPAERLHMSAEVRASLDCGRAPLGYVLFHELIDYVYARALLWFPVGSRSP